jgi:alanine dehydrogenase
MRIGVPREIKADERRVALTPAGTREATAHGHEVVVERGVGAGSGFTDDAYAAQGARVVESGEAVFAEAELILKVKEPQPQEVELLEPHHVLFTYLHLAADPGLTEGLCASRATCIAYETVEDADGRLPLLAPMSEIAGRIATQVGASILTAPEGGRGVLMGGIPGVPPATVVVAGGGVAGENAAAVASGMGARVVVLDRSPHRLRELQARFGSRVTTLFSTDLAIEQLLPEADLVIGTVLVRGARAPRLVRRPHLALMRPGSVLVDVSIDQGGCFETSYATTHSHPTYEVEGVLHYCVANMPGSVPVTATAALTNATLPYVLALADLGVHEAMTCDAGLRAGLNVACGAVVHPVVAREFEELASAFASAA